MVDSRLEKRERKTTSAFSASLRAYGFRLVDVREFARFSGTGQDKAAETLIGLADADFNGKRISDWHLGRKRAKDWYSGNRENAASRAQIAREFFTHHLG